MSQHRTKAEEQKLKNEAYVERILEANETLEVLRGQLVEAFRKPVISSSRDPQRLAKTLSTKFTLLKVTVSYEGGNMSIYAEPLPLQYPANSEYHLDHWYENQAAKARMAVENPDYRWPSHAEVAAYSKGFEEGMATKGDLEDKIQQLKNENERLRDGGPFGPPAFMSPYFRRGPWG
jgi:hypothetical protein